MFLWDENIEDYIMIMVFDAYVRSCPFMPVFCRMADPESKGKVENCVKNVTELLDGQDLQQSCDT